MKEVEGMRISNLINLNLNLVLVGSWKYKYAIFDMIEVYKYFDWDNYTMVVYG